MYLEQVVRVACEDYGGTVRVFAGDTAIFTFSDAAPALSALDALCHSWDEYVQAHAIRCPLLVGMHRGTLAVFRSFAFGDALKVSTQLNDLMRVIRRDETRSCVAISGQIREMVRGSEWDSRLRALEREQMPPGLGDIQVYELLSH
jgi:class 3 adenylate cyclase